MDNNKLVTGLLAFLAVIAAGTVLKAAQSVVLPLIIAWLLSYVFGPVVNFLSVRRVPTPLSTLVVLVLLMVICYLGGRFLYERAETFVAQVPEYQTVMTRILSDASERFSVEKEALENFNIGEKLSAQLLNVTERLLSFVSNLVLVMVFLVFLLLGKPYYEFKVRKALSPENAARVARIQHSIAIQIGQYLAAQFLISAVTGFLVWLVLHLLKVDFAITWGALAFFLNFIPTIGSILASIPPILVAFIQYYPSMWQGVVTLLCLLTIQMVIGNGIAPKVFGDKLNMSPVVVLISLIFWGWLWGPVGAILSVPLAAAVKIVCENIDALKPISIMMGSGRLYARDFEPASSPENG